MLEMEVDKGSGGSQKIKTICWNSRKSSVKSLGGGKEGVERRCEVPKGVKQRNRLYIR